jgi:hypothetical protein
MLRNLPTSVSRALSECSLYRLGRMAELVVTEGRTRFPPLSDA